MEIAAIENEQIPSPHVNKHHPIHLIYIITTTVCFLIQVYQRISIDLFYGSYTTTNIPSFNRYPTEFTASYTTISYIWYLVYIWQTIWIIYSLIGLFRRTSSSSLGSYFYQYPCAMNQSAFFYTTIALLLYIPQLTASTNNTYSTSISVIRYSCASWSITFALIIVNATFEDNLRDYFRGGYFLDVWLTRIFYQNGLALWASILFYESCLSITIGLIYSNMASSAMASLIGMYIFFTGIILLFMYEFCDSKDTGAFTFLHWFVYYWINMNIGFSRSKYKFQNSASHAIIELSISYSILFYIVYRIRILYFIYQDNNFRTVRSRKVYSLVVSPRNF